MANTLQQRRQINVVTTSLCVAVAATCFFAVLVNGQPAISFCPAQELITPCRCYQRSADIQVWCSHSDLPRIIIGLKALARHLRAPIDELILENNQLPSLPARFFSPLKIYRLMLRHNGIERVSAGWLGDLDDHLMEVYVVERTLRNIPPDSLNGLLKLEAVTIESEHLKRVPRFGVMPRLKYVRIESASLIELLPGAFRDLPALETVFVSGSSHLNRLEAAVFENLPRLVMLNLQHNGINYLHGKALSRLPALKTLDLSDNEISDARMVGRAIRQLQRLESVTLTGNHITSLATESFVDLPVLQELQLQRNAIAEIQYGAFFNTPRLRHVHLADNFIQRIHADAFLQFAGQSVEYFHVQNNEISGTDALRAILDALPRLKFLDVSRNRLVRIAFGAVRNHEALEQLYLDHNRIEHIERDAFMAMPALRELRLKNNSLSNALDFPIWNLPGLKGLDLSANRLSRVDPMLLVGLPSLRHLDVSENRINSVNSASFDSSLYLETINISYNKIATIHPSTFQKLDHLFELDASHNEMRDFIPGLPRIVERVSLSGNRIANLPLAAGKVLNLPNLKMLNLDGNDLYRIPRLSMQHLGKLRYLSLAENRLQTIDEFSLSGLKELEQLNLQDNKLMAMHEKSLESLRKLNVLNLKGNRLELMVDRLLSGSEKLRHLDMSQNNIIEMTDNVFAESRVLEYLDLSHNNLKVLPGSMTGMTELKILDISNNQLTNVSADMFSSFGKLEELRVSNNKVRELTKGALRSLPHLEYLDLSSNELSMIERNAIRNCPQLKELVLADNLLTEMGDRVCEDLPNLQAVHLQHNRLQHISPSTFYRSPSIVYLNVSLNNFDSLQNIGINSIRNVEVLDVSGNGIRRLSTSDLHGLDWLVELKLDDNRICRVQGEPFNAMPRLRVLTMRNNRIARVGEQTFRSVRGNLGVFDLDGNPLRCSCEMLWLRAWYQETNSLTRFPGPRCSDGSMLRDLSVSQADCQQELDGLRSQRQQQQQKTQQLLQANALLTNEHGDSYGQLDEDFGRDDGCDQVDEISGQIGGDDFPGDSKYFTDRYIEYIANNDSSKEVDTRNETVGNNPLLNLNNTLLNYNRHKLEQQYLQQTNSPLSKFTFFGMPLPNLNMGSLWNFGRKKDAKTRAEAGTRGKPRLQVYRPGEIEFYKFLNHRPAATGETGGRAKIVHDRRPSAVSDIVGVPGGGTPSDLTSFIDPISADDNPYRFHRPPFRTTTLFAEPTDVEHGGFHPILPVATGNFRPMVGPPIDIEETAAAEAAPPAGVTVGEENLAPSNSDRVKFVSGQLEIVNSDAETADISSTTSTPKQQHPTATVRYEVVTEMTTEAQHKRKHNSKRPSKTTTTTTMMPNSAVADANDELLIETDLDVLDFISSSTPSAYVTLPPTVNSGIIDSSSGSASTTTNSPSTIKRPPHEIWPKPHQPPSSLSALVAPGAQLSNYRPLPIGRSTIVKLSTTPSPATPKAAEYHQTTPRTPSLQSAEQQSQNTGPGVTLDQFTHPPPRHPDAAQLNSATASRKASQPDMSWYFENYNRAPSDVGIPVTRGSGGGGKEAQAAGGGGGGAIVGGDRRTAPAAANTAGGAMAAHSWRLQFTTWLTLGYVVRCFMLP